MKKFLVVALGMLVLAGCSNTQGTGPISGIDRHSGSKTIIIQPHGTDCESMQCIALGAFWTESEKDYALLTVSLMNTSDFIRSAHLEIDGVKYPLRDDGDLTRYDRPLNNVSLYVESKKDYIIPLDIVKKITTAKKAWIFVQTGSGYMSNAIIDAQGDSKAYYALQRFLTALPKS
ncbi:lipoprotein [Citrobacter koseri]|uniref:lipoprotein n=1 Tax=Citrobacter koseri TaxID=545 RepID=UPI0023B075BE|nr:lipoprotein [Citrobacter koseri]